MPNEINICIFCTSNISFGSGEMVSSANGGEFADTRENNGYSWLDLFALLWN